MFYSSEEFALEADDFTEHVIQEQLRRHNVLEAVLDEDDDDEQASLNGKLKTSNEDNGVLY